MIIFRLNILIRKINSDEKVLLTDSNFKKLVIRKISIKLEKKTRHLGYREDPYGFKILLFCGKGLNKLNKPTKIIIGDYGGREYPNIKERLIKDAQNNRVTNLGNNVLGDLIFSHPISR